MESNNQNKSLDGVKELIADLKLNENLQVATPNDSNFANNDINVMGDTGAHFQNIKLVEELPAITSNNTELSIKQGDSHQQKTYNLNSKSPASDSILSNKKQSTSGFAKILQWDPWYKIRRNKKDKKLNDKQRNMADFLANTDGPKSAVVNTNVLEENYYKQEIETMFCTKKSNKAKSKVVRFQTDVTVLVYGHDNKILKEITEPLKKEQDQQERNKELRKDVGPEGLRPGNKKRDNNYMSGWTYNKK